MNGFVERVQAHLQRSAEVKLETARECADDIARAAELLAESLGGGGKLLLCGNGGSAADCQHIAAEFVSLLNQKFNRPALPALALTTDSSFLTANANDFGFEGVFARQVEAFGQRGDVLIGISTSGGSRNVLAALERAGERGLKRIALMGRNGPMAQLADVAIRVPSDSTQHIQEAHIAIGHAICELAEGKIFESTAPPADAEREITSAAGG